MKLEHGKTYLNGYGQQIQVFQIHEPDSPYRFTDGTWTYTEDGAWCQRPTRWDLVSEAPMQGRTDPVSPQTQTLLDLSV
jgi:hypothetical protein